MFKSFKKLFSADGVPFLLISGKKSLDFFQPEILDSLPAVTDSKKSLFFLSSRKQEYLVAGASKRACKASQQQLLTCQKPKKGEEVKC